MKAATLTEEQAAAYELIFQSTPPVKAATLRLNAALSPDRISIHAAREGGDKLADIDKNSVSISIHAAREGGDQKGRKFPSTVTISIHAAREGGDCGV